MPLTRSKSKLQQLEQFAFTSTVNSNNKKRERNFTKNLNNPPNKRRKLNAQKSNKKVTIKYDTNDQKQSSQFLGNTNVQIKESPFIPLTKDIITEGNSNSAPQHWNDIYDGIFNMRLNGIARNAEVDTIGAAKLFDKTADAKTQRFHVLVSLLLSSQTKDSVTAEAVSNLQKHFNGLTVESICSVTDLKEIDKCIGKVGFHNKKTQYLFKTANILKDKYESDCPRTVKGLCALTGIGPKMAYIAMQIMWNECVGVGIDVHCHRIMNLLGWTRNKKCKTAEQTRKEIQEWVPHRIWPSMNRLFVGFGQTVCKKKFPKCDVCEIAQYCPIGRIKLAKNKNSMY